MGDVDLLREAYEQWPLFASLIDIAEMSLAKSNADLAGRFLALGGRPDITERILSELSLTQTWVLRVLQQDRLLERKQVLGSAIALRVEADAAALESLPGVGPTTAAAIVSHRDSEGPFRSVDALVEVRGIGEAKLEAIRDLVSVG